MNNSPLPFGIYAEGYLNNPLYSFVIDGSESNFDSIIKRIVSFNNIPGFILTRLEITFPED